MSANRETLYIKGQRNIEVKKTEVTLGDILAMECSNKTLIPKIRALRIIKIPAKKNHREVVSVLKVIACIHENYPNVDVQNMGETDIIVTYEKQKTTGKVLHILKAAAVSLITFCGAAFAIMAFNNDASVTDIFTQVEQFVTGDPQYQSMVI